MSEVLTDALPVDMAWVYNHPSMGIRSRSSARYPPPPSQGAENLLASITADEKARIAFFRQAQSFLLKQHERVVLAADVAEIQAQETRSIGELEELIAQLKE